MRALISLISLLLVLLVVLLEASRTSPGELSAVHSQSPELLAPKKCAVCQGQGGQRLDEACLACHEAVASQLNSAIGFHGQLEPSQVTDCVTCHGEHLGSDFNPGATLSFALAGIDKPDQFDHRALGWQLHGAHDSASCEQCHPNAESELLEPGEGRFIGLDQNCTSCHEDVHEQTYGSNCAECHGQSAPFEQVAEFEHDPRYPLLGAHASINCTQCHDPASEHAIGNVQDRVRSGAARRTVNPNARESCADCHRHSHSQTFLTGVAQTIGGQIDQSCSHCHQLEQESFRGVQVPMTAALHANTGFALSGPHGDLDCAQCHADFGDRDAGANYFAAAYPGRQAQQCAACHEDPHEARYGQDCTQCHGPGDAFEQATRFVHPAQHPLSGSHAQLACVECHQAQTRHSIAALLDPANRDFNVRDERNSCGACHDDPHAPQFLSGAAATLSVTPEDSCEECHEIADASFRDRHSELPAELHASSGFALVAPHAELDCAQCHQDIDQPQNSGHSFRQLFPGREPSTCQSCHEDPHRGQFDQSPYNASCLACHSPTAFTPIQFGITQHANTKFALTGSHTAVGCNACHQPKFDGLFSAAPTECAACHKNPHGSRFDRIERSKGGASRSGCARCHDTDSFNRIRTDSFEHTRWTGFALVGKHAAAECRACHQPSAKRSAQGFRFGPAAGSRCIDCHSDIHLGQFGDGGPTNCGRCHAPSESSFLATRFDHKLDSRFELDEVHRKLNCTACHQSFKLPNGSEVTRYRPLPTRCVDCHDPGSLKR